MEGACLNHVRAFAKDSPRARTVNRFVIDFKPGADTLENELLLSINRAVRLPGTLSRKVPFLLTVLPSSE